MPNLSLSLAMGDYDHTRDLLDGKVGAEGIDLTCLRLPVEEIFHRFIRSREWDVSEMSLGKTVSFLSQPQPDIVALPVFPSRAFRHSSIYVRADTTIKRPENLAGKRVGVPEWAQTASIYTRGLLAHEYGVDLNSIHWYQAGVNDAGRAEKVELHLPAGIRYTPVPNRSLSDLLVAGELDAVLSARPPMPYADGTGRVRRLFEDYRPVELAYWEKTGVFPNMHVVAVKRDTFERNPWIAMNLLEAFEAAKDRSLRRAVDITASFYPLPWISELATTSRQLMGADFWPYGIEPNRVTLAAFLQYASEQGVTPRRLTVEELFPAVVQSRVKV